MNEHHLPTWIRQGRAEAALLGHLLQGPRDPSVAEEVVQVLRELPHALNPNHAEILDQAEVLMVETGRVGAVELASRIGGGLPRLSESLNEMRGAGESLEIAVRRVRQVRNAHHAARMLLAGAEALGDSDVQDAGIVQVVDQHSGAALAPLHGSKSSSRAMSAPDIARVIASQRPEQVQGVTTWGDERMDRALGPCPPREITMLLGLTGEGKSVATGGLALHTASRGPRVLLVLTEMDEAQYGVRWLQNLTGLTPRNLREQLRTEGGLRKALELLPDRLSAIATQSCGAVEAEVRRAARDGDPYRVVVWDYFQELEVPGRKWYRRFEELEEVGRVILRMAKQYEHAAVVAAQFNRQQVAGAPIDEAPSFSNIAECSRIVKQASVIHVMRTGDPGGDGMGGTMDVDPWAVRPANFWRVKGRHGPRTALVGAMVLDPRRLCFRETDGIEFRRSGDPFA